MLSLSGAGLLKILIVIVVITSAGVLAYHFIGTAPSSTTSQRAINTTSNSSTNGGHETKINFTESGLPNGTSWAVKSSSNTSVSKTAVIYVPTPATTTRYTFSNISSNGCLYSPTNSSIIASSSAAINVKYNKEYCNTSFIESGLPTDLNWSLIVGTLSENSESASILLELSPAPHSFSVSNSSQGKCVYYPSPKSGSVNSSTISSIYINFTGSCLTYFNETGLPAGATWNVSYGKAYTSSAAGYLQFNSLPGAYSFKLYNLTVSSCLYSANVTKGNFTAGHSKTIKYSEVSCSFPIGGGGSGGGGSGGNNGGGNGGGNHGGPTYYISSGCYKTNVSNANFIVTSQLSCGNSSVIYFATGSSNDTLNCQGNLLLDNQTPVIGYVKQVNLTYYPYEENYPQYWPNSTVFSGALRIANSSYITVENCRISAGYQAHKGINGIALDISNHITLSNVTVLSALVNGTLANGTTPVRLRLDGDALISTLSVDNLFKNDNFSINESNQNDSSNIYFHDSNATTIENSIIHYDQVGVTLDTSDSIRLINNTFIRQASYGVLIDACISRNFTYSGNVGMTIFNYTGDC